MAALHDMRNNVADGLWQKGFTLRQILIFFRDKVRPMRASMTTEDVVREIIIPETATHSTCYMESDFMRLIGGPKRATTLVSHALKCKFSNTMLNMVIDASGKTPDELYNLLGAYSGERDDHYWQGFFDGAGNISQNTEDYLLEILSPDSLSRTYWLCVLAINEHKALCGDCWTCRDKKKRQLRPEELQRHVCECGIRKRNPCGCGTLKFCRDDPMREVDKIVNLISCSEYAQEVLVSLDPDLETLERIWVLKEINEAARSKQIRFGCIVELRPGIKDKLKLGKQVVTSVKNSHVADEAERDAVLKRIPDTDAFDSFVACMVEMNLGIFHTFKKVTGDVADSLQRLSQLRVWCSLSVKALTELGWGNTWEKIENVKHLCLGFWYCEELVDVSCLQTRLNEIKELQHLEICFVGCQQLADVSSIGQGLKEMEKLKHLQMEFYDIHQRADVSSIGQSMKGMKTLQHLHMDFEDCSQLAGVSCIAQGMKEMKDLHHLHIRFVSNPQMADLSCIGQGMKEMKRLQHLHMVFDDLANVSSIGQSMMEMKYLQHLHMSLHGCRLLADVSCIGRGMKEMTELRYLHMNYRGCNQITDVSHIGQGMIEMKKLRHLHMDFSNCRQLVDVSSIGQSMKEMKYLQHLHMNYQGCNQITDVSRIGQSMIEMKKLQHLHMDFVDCRQLADVSSIGQSMKEMKNLQHLHMCFYGCYQLSDVSSIGQGMNEMNDLLHLHMDFAACRQLADVSTIAQGITQMKDLQHLHLSLAGCRRFEDVSCIGHGMKKLMRLQHVHMDFVGCERLAPNLRACFRSLQELLDANGQEPHR